jgi:outer membrane protein OmpA-like peptidoglycan-associated protein
MKRRIYCLAVSLGFIVASCGSPEKMKDAADQIKVKSTPEVLEARAGTIKAKITVTFPEKFFHPDATLEMLPVIKYAGGEVAGDAKLLQGEKVKDNNTVITQKGGEYTQELTFDFIDEMKVATLEIRPTLIVKGQRLQFPKDIKAADGVIATYKLAEVEAQPVTNEDEYVKTIEESKEAEIKFIINQAIVRNSELNKAEVKTLQQFVADALKSNGKQTVKELQISSYASPDGAESLNEKLSANRGKSSNNALSTYLKKSKIPVNKDLVSVKNTAEDWEGFQELMAASDIQDKELVLRVLSMYNDPAVREREIKNISAVYKVIADQILPELRRSKLLATVEVANLTDAEIKALVDAGDLETLDVEQLLYAADKLYTDKSVQLSLYKKASESFSDFRAYNNLAALYLDQKKVDDAKSAADAALAANGSDAKVKNNAGYVALLQGNTAEAEKQLTSAGLDESKAGLGYLAIGKGEYSQALTLLKGSKSVNEALALLLNGKIDEATAVLADLNSPKAYYLKAVIAARQNNESSVLDNLNKAFELDATLKDASKKDAEFAAFWQKIQ